MFPRQLEESDSKLTGIFIKGQYDRFPDAAVSRWPSQYCSVSRPRFLHAHQNNLFRKEKQLVLLHKITYLAEQNNLFYFPK